MSEEIQHPKPAIDGETRPWWEGAGRGEIVLQRSRRTGRIQHPPRAVCSETLETDVEHFVASGRGRVHTFTITHQNQAPAFARSVPYVLAYVELEEGPRVLTNIVGCDPSEVRIDMPVIADFSEPSNDVAILRFRPA